MPSFAPRQNSDSKQVLLERRKAALWSALQRGEPRERLERLAEQVRSACLALAKAELHWLLEPRVKVQNNTRRVARLKREMELWGSKSADDIYREVR